MGKTSRRLSSLYLSRTLHLLLTGQICTGGSRVYVQEGIYDKFLAKFTETAQGITAAVGDPFSNAAEEGPLISEAQFDVHELLQFSKRSLTDRVISSVSWGTSILERKTALPFI
jgi:Aldehyde dehydrogenase family